MDQSIIRYRIRNKSYLCLSPEEAVSTGVTAGEQIVERVILRTTLGWRCQEFAVIRTEPIEQLAKLDPLKREELIFTNRREAIEFLNSQPSGLFILCAIVETQTVPKEEIESPSEFNLDRIISQGWTLFQKPEEDKKP
ncbi:MAG: hypothetical protein NC911_08650 [Candidatus Omnitrophica bacterium]|nr:hypothetical protein [Candidatus Omnitrophota bacterium]MCM8769716.1 hypothetical protein [Candidatus Omnitrophota bacterium]